MLSQQSFDTVTQMFQRVSGIRLVESKKALVAGRLQKLAQARGMTDVNQYVEALMRENNPDELVRVIDNLTTNETYFYREPEHFTYLSSLLDARPAGGGEFRVWSAASSSGEEGYSIGMLLANKLGLSGWQVIGTDLSTQMVESARRGLYTMERARNVPVSDLRKWCRKGSGQYEGHLLMSRELRDRVHYQGANLTQTLPEIGQFDVIFLRNVLIYFENPGKIDIVKRVLTRLKPGGVLFTGHAESLTNLNLPLKPLAPAVYAQN